LCTRRIKCDASFQTACHGAEFAAGVSRIGIDLKSDPDIRSLIKHVGLEISAKNPDYLIRLSPEHERVSYDGGISTKASLPKAVT